MGPCDVHMVIIYNDNKSTPWILSQHDSKVHCPNDPNIKFAENWMKNIERVINLS